MVFASDYPVRSGTACPQPRETPDDITAFKNHPPATTPRTEVQSRFPGESHDAGQRQCRKATSRRSSFRARFGCHSRHHSTPRSSRPRRRAPRSRGGILQGHPPGAPPCDEGNTARASLTGLRAQSPLSGCTEVHGRGLLNCWAKSWMTSSVSCAWAINSPPSSGHPPSNCDAEIKV